MRKKAHQMKMTVQITTMITLVTMMMTTLMMKTRTTLMMMMTPLVTVMKVIPIVSVTRNLWLSSRMLDSQSSPVRIPFDTVSKLGHFHSPLTPQLTQLYK